MGEVNAIGALRAAHFRDGRRLRRRPPPGYLEAGAGNFAARHRTDETRMKTTTTNPLRGLAFLAAWSLTCTAPVLRAAEPAGTPAPAAPAPAAPAPVGEAVKGRKPPERFEKEIEKMEAAVKSAPPADGAILFLGSSSIRLWKLSDSFPDRTVLNRGFGGSCLADSVHYAPRLVWPHQPAAIVIYAGDNDLGGGLSPEETAADFGRLVAKIREKHAETPILYVAVKPSIKRWNIFHLGKETNRLIAEQCAAGKNLTFVDIVGPMLGEDGKPRPELYVKDGLHMTPEGYKVWTDVLTPLLDKVAPQAAKSPETAPAK